MTEAPSTNLSMYLSGQDNLAQMRVTWKEHLKAPPYDLGFRDSSLNTEDIPEATPPPLQAGTNNQSPPLAIGVFPLQW